MSDRHFWAKNPSWWDTSNSFTWKWELRMCLQLHLHWNQAGYASDVYRHLAESVSQSCHLEESCLVCLFCCRVNTRHPRLGVTLEAARHNKWRPPLRTTFSRSIKAAWNSSSRRIGSSTAEAAVKRTLSSGQLMFRNKRSHIQTRASLKIQSE